MPARPSQFRSTALPRADPRGPPTSISSSLSARSASASPRFTASCQARTISSRSRFIALASAIAMVSFHPAAPLAPVGPRLAAPRGGYRHRTAPHSGWLLAQAHRAARRSACGGFYPARDPLCRESNREHAAPRVPAEEGDATLERHDLGIEFCAPPLREYA